MDLIIAITILIVCYFTGKFVEKSHYKKIKQREILLIKEPYLSFEKKALEDKKIISTNLVASNVVLGCDKFRALLANLRNVFGGHVSTFETLMDRGKREALLRVREKAKALNANIVLNIKIDTVNLELLDPKCKFPKICVTAYGTAIKYAK